MISEEEHEQMPEPVRERLEALKDAPGSVIVVGSMNADYTVTTKRLPKPGETVNGGAMKVLPGGKGANQASAAARLGVNVQLLGAVGEDSNADFLLSKLDEAGVDTADILHVEGPSGTTVITVSAEGENTIVYSPGSNAKASAGYVQSHRTTIAECAVLGLCLESPIATVIAAAQTAHDAGVTVLLNDSPFMDELPHELVEATDILLVNQHEVAQLLGLPDDDVESLDWYEVAERFTDYGFDRAIVTLGASGSVVIENGRWHRVSAAQVNAVDTTGCGDSFMGTVLAGLAAGHTLLQSAQIGSCMAGNPFRSQCLGHRPYRFRQNIGCVSLSHRPIDDRATHAACRCACAVYLAVKGARGRCGQEPRTAFGGHCCTMRGARAARTEDRGRHSFRRHHRTGAAAHSLPSTGYPRYHARIVVFVAHFEGRADSRHCRYGDRR